MYFLPMTIGHLELKLISFHIYLLAQVFVCFFKDFFVSLFFSEKSSHFASIALRTFIASIKVSTHLNIPLVDWYQKTVISLAKIHGTEGSNHPTGVPELGGTDESPIGNSEDAWRQYNLIEETYLRTSTISVKPFVEPNANSKETDKESSETMIPSSQSNKESEPSVSEKKELTNVKDEKDKEI
eukprot:TRINITY_DN3443_c0_g1_i1.p1 TRINITY_DN3443_c0_g1~~TRINITY_DN3443_c0_g1_i1.p1  ORF type:complete len:184 (-),score=27.76 TRINITY_DN3443_c0_g1_i1:261-812(-)